jgi:hypothetical protein
MNCIRQMVEAKQWTTTLRSRLDWLGRKTGGDTVHATEDRRPTVDRLTAKRWNLTRRHRQRRCGSL